MGLATGTKLGPYEILSPVGAGGMGEVYRARDTRLGRDVAIKVLPEGFAQDADRLRRFEQEARSVATLNHPNIVAVYDVGTWNGAPYLVSELLDGATLREKLRAGSLPVRRAIELGLQIAYGLAAAHERGIIHRDLKPENIFVSPDGRVKILDFGLAKLARGEGGSAPAADGRTISAGGETTPGMVVGTVGYMAPEQVKGAPAVQGSDVFALGTVLYEMLAGRRAFKGETSAETMAAILKEDPPEIGSLNKDVPPGLERVVRRCLEKEPANRFQSAKDLAFALEAVSGSSASGALPALPVRQLRLARLMLAGTAILTLTVGFLAWSLLWREKGAVSQPVRRLVVSISEPLALASFAPVGIGRPAIAISPDGSKLVYVGNRNGRAQLFVRDLGQFESRAIPGTEGAFGPFFAPDGLWVGFFSGIKLKKVSVVGGEPVIICEARNPYGATWGPDGTIVFADFEGVYLSRVPSSGGTAQILVRSKDWAEESFNGPSFLPDGKSLLFSTHHSSNPDYSSIELLSLTDGRRKVLLEGGTYPMYARSGHLLFLRGGALLAAPFDLSRFELTGPAAALVQSIRTEVNGLGEVALSSNGTLVYVEGSPMWKGELVWLDPQGKLQPLGAPAQTYGTFRLSPEGRRLAVVVAGVTDDVWVYEIGRGTFLRLTQEGNNTTPIWTPDGKRVTYGSLREGKWAIVSRPADASGPEERLWASTAIFPNSWSPDGKVLATDCGVPNDICLFAQGAQQPQVFAGSRFTEWGAAFSPDGKWIAYTSDESGRYEVYVRPYPGPGGQWQISTDGGEEPVWSRKGRELYYRSGSKWMAVRFRTDPGFAAEPPRVLFEGPYVNVPGLSSDVASDGRFVLIRGPEEAQVREVRIVLNWFEELKHHGSVP